jgi:DNA-binding MarR family transcriptional regulator
MLLRDAHMSFNRRLREALAQHAISFSQYQHLRHLWQSDGLVQTELSRRIGIETASSTAVIDQLEKRGLIRRQRDASDRRRIIVTLMPAGRALERPLDDCAIIVNRRARASLPDAQMAGLFKTMRRIIDNLRTQGR